MLSDSDPQKNKTTKQQNQHTTMKKDWKIWLQIALTVLTALASALGVTSCAMKML